MNFIIVRETLLKPLQQIVNIIEKRQTMPILANVLLKIDANTLLLTGTDLEIQIIDQVSIKQTADGAITVPARKLLDICRLLPSGAEIDFQLQEDKLKIKSARSRFTLSTLPADDYPEFSESEMDCSFMMKAGKLANAFDKTLFCMANQDVRYYLNGLMLNISNKQLKFVASDGHRLSVYETDIEQQTALEDRIIIPRKAIIELNRLLEDSDADVSIQFSRNHIKVTIEELIFLSKLIDAKYPDFSKVFQQPFFEPIHLDKTIFKDALTRVAILSNEKLKGVGFVFAENQLLISTHNPIHEEAEETLSIDYAQDQLDIAFNAQYILDALSHIDTDQVILTIASNASSCFIEQPEENKFRFIVMPMKL